MSDRARGTGTQAPVDAAVAKSHLARLPLPLRVRLLGRNALVRLPSRAYFVHEGDPARLGLVLSGLLRCFRATADGRELTLIWAHQGAIVGVASMVHPPSPWSFQAIADSVLLDLPIDTWGELLRTDAAVAGLVATQYDELLRRAVDEILIYAHGDLRRRLIIRLLELVSRSAEGGPLIAAVTQDDLARSVGATRPSVARVLQQLRAEKSIRSMYGGILVERPESLAAQL
ncbi:MAG: Crp/Fnr family transcriptional regulator [Chloroflexi bacterium]|nr:MAG: Crp/Fnr family transcriptional regulator [Chloroflexota bacterium]